MFYKAPAEPLKVLYRTFSCKSELNNDPKKKKNHSNRIIVQNQKGFVKIHVLVYLDSGLAANTAFFKGYFIIVL